jgi:hypothetical protein
MTWRDSYNVLVNLPFIMFLVLCHPLRCISCLTLPSNGLNQHIPVALFSFSSLSWGLSLSPESSYVHPVVAFSKGGHLNHKGQ